MSVSQTSASNRSPKLSASAIAATKILRSSGSGPERPSLKRCAACAFAARSSTISKRANERSTGFSGGKTVPTVESCALPIVLARDADHNERRVQGLTSRVHWPGAWIETRNHGGRPVRQYASQGDLFAPQPAHDERVVRGL